MTNAVTDRIEKKVLIHAPRSRVWRAISDVKEFREWFGVRFDRPFAPGATMRGILVGTSVDPQIAEAQQRHKAIPFDVTIDRIEPERTLSFRWHPYAINPAVDYSTEPTTLIVFALEDAPGGTMLTVTESGFDQIPLARRAEAFTSNEQGWSIMLGLVEKYVAQNR
jgi:uncharacterized protein YndB with AHSA1/START domain